MTKKKDGGDAFPRAEHFFPGMSLRDYFAGEMLSGILANSEDWSEDWDERVVARNCYKMADAMLDEREKNQ